VKVLTWNVLHRTHAETHQEPACTRWPREHERIEESVVLLREAMNECRVALLQEVSGDLLSALRKAMPERAIIEHAYPRVPRQRVVSESLTDLTEYLVVIAPLGSIPVRAHTYENDHGKGYLLAWTPGGTLVLSTHVTWGEKRDLQLATLARLMRQSAAPLVVGGDFNASRAIVAEALGAGAAIGEPARGSPPTRPYGDPSGAGDIDHLIARGGVLRDVTVLENRELSDHRPVMATFSAIAT
jgi:endonuclease/exonuclease/phosphatase family metal-dependent hydrolase